ncbi:MAG: peptidase M20 [Thiotrichales bacterium]|nr:peptidase M20 [Thiotrichales bacterium]
MDSARTAEFVDDVWEQSIVPTLIEYIRIPNKSPMFDPEWAAHGHMDEAVALLETWARKRPIDGMSLEVVRIANRTPLIFIDIPGDSDDVVLLYGHLDKQPEMEGWEPGLGPWTPVLRDDKLYGRGGADDGYSIFAALTAIEALQTQSVKRAHCVVIIEACEESGSDDLPHYIDALNERIGNPDLVVCLDSGCGNYDQLWCTTSLRGSVGGNLRVDVLSEGVHSGDAGGIVPSSFRILRQLLSRVENEQTGEIKASLFDVQIPEQRRRQATHAAGVLGSNVYDKFPWMEGTEPGTDELAELVLNRTWRPALEITGASGLPAIADAGNVARPQTTVKLSVRIPPTCDPERAADDLKTLLESEPPYGAHVEFQPELSCIGWDAPPTSDWLDDALHDASRTYFGADAVHMGEGGSIPFMGMLGEKFPDAQFLITGVLGPKSNAHGPNEFLHIPTGKKITSCVAQILAAHFTQA